MHSQKSAPYVGPNDWQWWLWPMGNRVPDLAGAVQHEVQVVLPHENTVAFIASNNWVFEATAQLRGAARQAMLATGARWISQAEPQSYRTDFSDAIGLVVNADATFITERLYLDEDGQSVAGATDLDPHAQPVRLSANPLSAFQVVLARSLGRVYLLSGGQVWSGPIDGPVDLAMPSVPIGTVLAATYEPQSRALFALRDDGALVKLPLFGGAPSTVATVARIGEWQRYFVVPDRDGALFVALTTSTSYQVWQLAPSGSFTLKRQRSAALAVAPVVELDRYLMVERIGSNQVALERIPKME